MDRKHKLTPEDDRYAGDAGLFQSLPSDSSEGGPIQSIEGWILFITGLHEEAQDDDIYEAFADYGQIKNMHINLDRRTGYLKGYGMIEYERLKEAETAIENMNGKTILGKTIQVDFAFKKPRGRGRA